MADGFDAQDEAQLQARNIERESVEAQLAQFRKGIAPTRLERPCLISDGIQVLNEPSECERLQALYDRAVAAGRIEKFVPASGAASRMFKELLALLNDPDCDARVAELGGANGVPFFESIERFAFAGRLNEILEADGYGLAESIANGDFRRVLQAMFGEGALNYTETPKGLIAFHRYGDEQNVRTAFAEHLAEAAAYGRDASGNARVHFTVSGDHLPLFEQELADVRPRFEVDGTKLDVGFSFQKTSTDTIAAAMDNSPFRDNEGRLVFRPGGHGALLENLADLDGDIVVVKNIDNVARESQLSDTVTLIRTLGGYLVDIQNQVFHHLDVLNANPSEADLLPIEAFCRSLNLAAVDSGESLEVRRDIAHQALDRPIRICGMVKNEGEPGGGPFWVREADGSLSAQIVESAQIDSSDPGQMKVWSSSSHFNPVLLICGVRNFRGQAFSLLDYRDPDRGILATKSYEGRELKALELPGLWNGSMARWLTIFVEMPIACFNPVKTVMDLLRDAHQGE